MKAGYTIREEVHVSMGQVSTDVTDETEKANATFMEDFSNGDSEAVASHYTENGSEREI